MAKFPTTLLEATRYFADDQRCIDTVASLRWPDGKPICPKCGAEENERKHYWFATQKRWKCYACRKQFSVKVNSIFEDSAISLDKWLVALWMLCNCKNGVSSYEIARDLNLTQKSAWFVLQRLREILPTESNHMFGADGGPVESDEAHVGPNPQRMHADRRRKAHAAGRYSNKASIHGLLDRELRQIRARVVPNVKRETLQNAILENVSPSAKLYTDKAVMYDGLDKTFVHEMVDHSREYVRGEVHTNGLENFWSLLKRTLRGTYVAVEPFHLDRYLAEQVFRFNNRTTKDNPLTDADRFTLAVSQISGKRLTFAALTGKVPPSF
ncbi:MAG: IS1595 family transposase [Terracidiphilus sp.]